MISPPLDALKEKTVYIRVAFGSAAHHYHIPAEPSPLLPCNVVGNKIRFRDPAYSSMIDYKVFHHLKYDGGFNAERLRDFVAIEAAPGYVFDLPTIQQWAVDTLRVSPGGVIDHFHEPLFIFSMQYCQSGSRPIVSHLIPYPETVILTEV
jgi:hypothetical protein